MCNQSHPNTQSAFCVLKAASTESNTSFWSVIPADWYDGDWLPEKPTPAAAVCYTSRLIEQGWVGLLFTPLDSRQWIPPESNTAEFGWRRDTKEAGNAKSTRTSAKWCENYLQGLLGFQIYIQWYVDFLKTSFYAWYRLPTLAFVSLPWEPTIWY